MVELLLQNRLLSALFGNPEIVKLNILEVKDLQIFFDIGDRVEFDHKGHHQHVGIVDRLNPRAAVIDCGSAGKWRVSYSALRHLDESVEASRQLRAQRLWTVAQRAHDLMGRHGLHGWTFCFSSTQRRLGKCNYKRQIIDVSLRHAVLDQTAEVTDTILHEIAHALAGPEAGHGPVWKKIAVRLNALPKSRAPESAEAAEAARCSRAQFEAGDSVRFVVKGTEKIGRIVRMNPKRAKVQTRDLRLWTVDYRLLSHTGQQGMR